MEKFFYAGSFDPFTLGHLHIVMRALEKYGKGVIGVAENPKKKPTFDETTRINMINDTLAYVGKLERKDFSDKIEIVSYDSMTVDAAIKSGATVLIRGRRNSEDAKEEEALRVINAKLCKIRGVNIRQEVFETDAHYRFISSSAVKQLCEYGEYIAAKQFVSPPVHNRMMEKYLYPLFIEHTCNHWMHTRGDDKRCWKQLVRQLDRPYHNLSHVACMINRMNIYGPERINNLNWFILAIFYHDYDLNSPEESYRQTGAHFLNFRMPEQVKDLIMATDHFGPKRKLGKEEQLIHDFDLAELADEDSYMSYIIGIRLEHMDVPVSDYVTERTKIIKKLKEQLSLPTLGETFEKQAKENLSAELHILNKEREEGLPQSILLWLR